MTPYIRVTQPSDKDVDRLAEQLLTASRATRPVSKAARQGCEVARWRRPRFPRRASTHSAAPEGPGSRGRRDRAKDATSYIDSNRHQPLRTPMAGSVGRRGDYRALPSFLRGDSSFESSPLALMRALLVQTWRPSGASGRDPAIGWALATLFPEFDELARPVKRRIKPRGGCSPAHLVSARASGGPLARDRPSRHSGRYPG
jgi:hypothetical protein